MYKDNIFNKYGFRDIPLPTDFDYSGDYIYFEEMYKELKKNRKLPPELKKKVRLTIEVYIPIIVVNGNLYSVDLNRSIENDFKDQATKIPLFIKNFKFLKYSNDTRKTYSHINYLLMSLLNENKLFFRHDLFFPPLFPEMDVIIISSNNFIQVFDDLRKLIEDNLEGDLKKRMKGVYLENKEELVKFQIFGWMLSKLPHWQQEITEGCFHMFKRNFQKKK